MASPDLLDHWLTIPVLCRLDQADLQDLARLARVRTFQPREYLWVAGDPIPGACFVLSGLVRAYMEDPAGRQSTYCLLWPGEMPAASVLQGEEWITHAVAVSPVVLATLPFQQFYAACLRTPQQARQVLDDVLTRAGNRYGREMHLRRMTLRRRLLRLFSRMSRLVGTSTPEGILLDFPLTHQTLADLTWVKRDHAGRVLSDIVEEGYVVPCPCFRWLVPDPGRIWRDVRLPAP